MTHTSTVLFGIEAGTLKGLDTLKWTLRALKKFSEILSISTIVQTNSNGDNSILRVVLKAGLSLKPEQIIQELSILEVEYNENIKVLETMRTFLLTYDQRVCLTPALILPHPQLTENHAWLYCSWEVWRNYRHPILEVTLDQLISSSSIENVEFFSQAKSLS